MPPGGWGRRAAGKVDRKLEDDALFKEIGGQLDANFDYTQWQRTGRQGGRNVRPPAPRRDERPFTVASGFTSASFKTGRPLSHLSTSTACHHGRKQHTVIPGLDLEMEKRRAETIKVLQLRIRARRQTIEEYRKRQLELLESNMKLRDEIDEEERVAHEEVKKLLRKYDKFRGGISTLNGKFGSELQAVKQDLDETKQEISQDLAGVQAEVDALDCRLQEQLRELNILANYKDKEYPVKALRIADLQKEIGQVKLQNDEAESELQHMVETEIEKLHQEQQHVHMEVKEKATQEALDRLHPSLEDMALQNMVMEKEVAFHKENHSELENSIATLQAEVKKLLQDPKSNVRLQMFPEFFPPQQKCTPDMDVVLNIPTQEWLPI